MIMVPLVAGHRRLLLEVGTVPLITMTQMRCGCEGVARHDRACCVGRGVLVSRWFLVLWTAGLLTAWLIGLVGLAVWGAATLLTCAGDCSTGNDWAWSGALIVHLSAFPLLAVLIALAWIRRRGSTTASTRWLGYGNTILAGSALLSAMSLTFLPDGRGPNG
jgi:hypothetical protein